MRTSSRTRWIVVVVIAALLVAAAGAAIAASTGGPDTPVVSDPTGGVPPPGGAGPVVVEPRPGMVDVYARPFDTATPSDDGMSVTIDFVSGVEPCTVLDHVDVRYGDRAVMITLFEGRDPDAGDVACIEIGVFKRVIVPLEEPLAGRDIVDGAA